MPGKRKAHVSRASRNRTQAFLAAKRLETDRERRTIELATEATTSLARKFGTDHVRFGAYGAMIHERTGFGDYHHSRDLTMEPIDANRTHKAHDASQFPRVSGIAVSPDSTEPVPSVRVNGKTLTIAEFRAAAKAHDDSATESHAARLARLRRKVDTQPDVD